MSAVAEVLRKALDSFGPNGEHWIKYIENDGHGNMCCYGAVRGVIPYLSPDQDVANSAIGALRTALGSSMIADWQDRDERTFPEVRELFLKAIAMAEKTA